MMKTYAKGSTVRKPMMYGGSTKKKMNMGGMSMSADTKSMPTPMMNKMNMNQGMMYGGKAKKKKM